MLTLAGQGPTAPAAAHRSLRAAGDEHLASLEAADRARLERDRRRRRVVAIDELLTELEERHLENHRQLPQGITGRLDFLEAEVGSLPRAVRRARTSPELHGALLDLQEEVLDDVVAARRLYADVA